MTRGKRSILSLIEYARKQGFKRISLISERKGNPVKLDFIEVKRNSWDWSDSIDIKDKCVILWITIQ